MPEIEDLQQSLKAGIECIVEAESRHEIGGLIVEAGATGKIVRARYGRLSSDPEDPVNMVNVDWGGVIRTYVAYLEDLDALLFPFQQDHPGNDPCNITFIGYRMPEFSRNQSKSARQLELALRD